MTAGPEVISDRPQTEHIDLCGLTHQGRVRAENQDHFFIASIHKAMKVIQTSIPQDQMGDIFSPSRGLVFLVADGVGEYREARMRAGRHCVPSWTMSCARWTCTCSWIQTSSRSFRPNSGVQLN